MLKRVLFILLILSSMELQAAQALRVAILAQGNVSPALMERITSRMEWSFYELGRFIPFSDSEYRTVPVREGIASTVESTIEALSPDLLLQCRVENRGGVVLLRIEYIPVNKEVPLTRGAITIHTAVPDTLPARAALTIGSLHTDMPLVATVLPSGNSTLLTAGQWHGLKRGETFSVSELTLRIGDIEQYRATVTTDKEISAPRMVRLPLYPDIKKFRRPLEQEIRSHVRARYTHQQEGPVHGENRYLEGLVFINPPANLVLPGYGAFLSTGYLGFGTENPDIPSLIFATSLMAAHLTTTEFMTGFSTNFFPWIQDSDKTDQMQNLQVYLWSTLPLTWTAAYMDQLAHQYRRSDVVPPFMQYETTAAVVFSTLLPGGGHFYKGQRAWGWLYHSAEITTGAMAAWHGGATRRAWLWTLAGIKLADILHAALTPSGYDYYQKEMPAVRMAFYPHSDISGQSVRGGLQLVF